MQLKRSHSCGELGEKQLKQKVVLFGWIANRRDHGGLTFIDLRDREGVTQVVFNPAESKEALQEAQSLSRESCIAIEGIVSKRPKGTENAKIATGKIEVIAKKLEVFNRAEQPLPIEVGEFAAAAEETRLKYRFLDLRRPELQKNLILRHKIVKATRDYFDLQGFIEVETPMLGKSTPEGSRDYLVPSRVNAGKFYALPQSPQLWKQILMVSGFEKYIQIARCFRDEDLRADRQPDFTQIDYEMSFAEEEDVMRETEGMLRFVMEKVFKHKIGPIPRMTFQEAMEEYGSDKPDIRFELKLTDVSTALKESQFNVFNEVLKKGGCIKAVCVPGAAEKFGKKELEELTEAAKIYKAKGLVTAKVAKGGIESQIAKFLSKSNVEALLTLCKAKEGDLLLLIADEWRTACTALGQVRLKVADLLKLRGDKKWNFVWVVDFPMFEWSEEDEKFVAQHHPFTHPKDEDLELLEKNPGKVRAKAYDIVMDGVELGGGSIRIHERELQERIFKCLGISPSDQQKKFGFLLDA
ncbi:MAG: aspartate--tRNA ligase, partial [Candidatus Diapherotrites archaeon]